MVVCKFFLQGTCKFGNSCRFEHQIPENPQGSAYLRPQPQASAQNMDPQALLRSVITDMYSVEHGKQWLFSSYTPFKDKPPFPGFEDKSFEEIRLGFYEATKNGTIEQYKQQLQIWHQEALARVRTLYNPSPEITNLLVQIYNKPPITNLANNDHVGNTSPFGLSSSNTIFGQPNQQKSVFGQSTQANSFGQNTHTSNAFAHSNNQPSNNTIFGQSNNQSNNVFGQNNQSNAFGQSVNKNVFAQKPAPLWQSSVNANPPQSGFVGSNAGLAQNTGSIFGGQPQGSIFARNPNQPAFGQKSVFGGMQSSASVFQQSSATTNNTGNEFGQNSPNSKSVFGQGDAHSQNVFGQNNVNQNAFAQNNTNVNAFTQNNSNNGCGQDSYGSTNPAQNNVFGSTGSGGVVTNASSSVFGAGTNPIIASNAPFLSNTTHISQNINSQSPFSAPPNAAIFDKPASKNTPLFQSSTSPFGNNPSQQNQDFSDQGNSLFGQKPSLPTDQSYTSAIYGQTTQQSIFGAVPTAVQVIDKSWYSKLEDLTPEEIKSFESPAFEFGRIPETPPTYEMCY